MTTSYSPHSPLFPTWGKFKYRSSVITECRNMVWIFNLLCHSWPTYGNINMHVLICIICFHVRVAIVVFPVRMLCCQAVYVLQLIESFFSQETKLNAQELFIYTKAWSKISYRWVIGWLYSKENTCTWYESTYGGEMWIYGGEMWIYGGEIWHAQIMRYGNSQSRGKTINFEQKGAYSNNNKLHFLTSKRWSGNGIYAHLLDHDGPKMQLGWFN